MLLFCKILLKDLYTWLLGNQMLVLWALTVTLIPHASVVPSKSNSYENSYFNSNGLQPSRKCLTVNCILTALSLVWVPSFYWLHNTTRHLIIDLENPSTFYFDTGQMSPFILWRAHVFPLLPCHHHDMSTTLVNSRYFAALKGEHLTLAK